MFKVFVPRWGGLESSTWVFTRTLVHVRFGDPDPNPRPFRFRTDLIVRDGPVCALRIVNLETPSALARALSTLALLLT